MSQPDHAETVLQSPKFAKLREKKAACLADLMRRKPSDKHYKRELRAFLEANAEVEKYLRKQIKAAATVN